MRKIVYYVAASLDGYIAGPNNDISGFVPGGNGINKYLSDLQHFDTCIMGRNTYEFGYQFGLTPGQPAYPHMMHYIFSNTLHFDNPHPQVKVCPVNINEILQLKQSAGSDIYLCGGGQFAGWLLDNHLIDILTIKLNPFIQGSGIRMFGSSTQSFPTELIDSTTYEGGLQIMSFGIGRGREMA